jgi:hypothetical protein
LILINPLCKIAGRLASSMHFFNSGYCFNNLIYLPRE